MHPLFKISIILFISIVLFGCSQSSPTPEPAPDLIKEYVELAVINQDEGAILGQIISTTDNQPLKDTVVRLAKVFWDEEISEGAFVLQGGSSPAGITDEQGVFVIDGLEPANYVIIVGEVIGYHEIISESDGSAKIYSVIAGEALEIESLHVNLP